MIFQKSVRIPGKVMLTGEYAVLLGGTAVLGPVPRYVEVIEIKVKPVVPNPPAVVAALSVSMREIMDFEEGYGLPHLMVDRTGMMHRDESGRPRKLGLGSSAAEAVGVIALRLERADMPWRDRREDVIRYALEAHRSVQGGLGSGADVVACAMERPVLVKRVEGKVHYERLTESTEEGRLPMALVWTGRTANTRDFIHRFNAWREKATEEDRKVLGELLVLSRQLGETWFRGLREEIFLLMDRYTFLMDRIADAADIPYRLPIHRKLERWARKYGGHSKPTGAGGGDMALLVGELPLERLKLPVIPLDVEAWFAPEKVNRVDAGDGEPQAEAAVGK